MYIKSSLIVLTILLAGCATKTRDDPGAFISLTKGSISATDTSMFADCLMDGFSSGYKFLDVQTRQHRRADGLRVETYVAGKSLSVSVDVFDDGKIEMLKSTRLHSLDVEPEEKAFHKCFKQFNGIEVTP